MRVDYNCSAECGEQGGFAYVDSGMICLGCHGPAVANSVSPMAILWRGQQEQIVELERVWSL